MESKEKTEEIQEKELTEREMESVSGGERVQHNMTAAGISTSYWDVNVKSCETDNKGNAGAGNGVILVK